MWKAAAAAAATADDDGDCPEPTTRNWLNWKRIFSKLQGRPFWHVCYSCCIKRSFHSTRTSWNNQSNIPNKCCTCTCQESRATCSCSNGPASLWTCVSISPKILTNFTNPDLASSFFSQNSSQWTDLLSEINSYVRFITFINFHFDFYRIFEIYLFDESWMG